MEEGLNKPLYSQRCLQTFFIFLSRALASLASSPMFLKRTKSKINQRLFTGYPRFHFHDVLEQLKTNFIHIFALKGFFVLW